MEIIGALLIMMLIGFVVWLGTTYIPMPDKIKQLIVILAVVLIVLVVILLVCNMFGVSTGFHSGLHVGRIGD